MSHNRGRAGTQGPKRRIVSEHDGLVTLECGHTLAKRTKSIKEHRCKTCLAAKLKAAQRFSPDEQRVLFAMGFGHGAVGKAQIHRSVPFYTDGYRAGQKAKGRAIKAYCNDNGLPAASPLREFV